MKYGTTRDIALHGYKDETTTVHNENGHVFGLPSVTYQDRRSHLCLGSVYRITARQVPGWTTDLIDKYHIQPITFRSTDITIHNSGEVHIPLPPQGG